MKSILVIIIIITCFAHCSHTGLRQKQMWEGFSGNLLQVHVSLSIPYNFSKNDVKTKMDALLLNAANKRAIMMLDSKVLLSHPAIDAMTYNNFRIHIYNAIKSVKHIDSYCHLEFCEGLYLYKIHAYNKNITTLK